MNRSKEEIRRYFERDLGRFLCKKDQELLDQYYLNEIKFHAKDIDFICNVARHILIRPDPPKILIRKILELLNRNSKSRDIDLIIEMISRIFQYCCEQIRQELLDLCHKHIKSKKQLISLIKDKKESSLRELKYIFVPKKFRQDKNVLIAYLSSDIEMVDDNFEIPNHLRSDSKFLFLLLSKTDIWSRRALYCKIIDLLSQTEDKNKIFKIFVRIYADYYSHTKQISSKDISKHFTLRRLVNQSSLYFIAMQKSYELQKIYIGKSISRALSIPKEYRHPKIIEEFSGHYGLEEIGL